MENMPKEKSGCYIGLDKEANDFYSAMNKQSNLTLPPDKIRTNLQRHSKNKEFIILLESGSLAPPHKMHLGLMEKVKNYFIENCKTKTVVGGFLIPSSDDYVKYKLKSDFIPLKHRVAMTKLLVRDSDWLECLDWGLIDSDEIRICAQKIINGFFPEYDIKCVLVFGVDYFLRRKKEVSDVCVCVLRPGYDAEEVRKLHPEKLIFVGGTEEEISSTLLRKAIREKDGKTVGELTSKEVVMYIEKNDIFQEKSHFNV